MYFELNVNFIFPIKDIPTVCCLFYNFSKCYSGFLKLCICSDIFVNAFYYPSNILKIYPLIKIAWGQEKAVLGIGVRI